jgi:hypothetical protein
MPLCKMDFLRKLPSVHCSNLNDALSRKDGSIFTRFEFNPYLLGHVANILIFNRLVSKIVKRYVFFYYGDGNGLRKTELSFHQSPVTLFHINRVTD